MKKNINGHEKVIQTRVIDKEEVISLTFPLIEKKNNNYRIQLFRYSRALMDRVSFSLLFFLSNYSSVVFAQIGCIPYKVK